MQEFQGLAAHPSVQSGIAAGSHFAVLLLSSWESYHMQESQCVIQKTKHSFVGNCFFQAKCHSPGDLRRANCRWLHEHGIHLFSRATPQCGSCNHSIFSESQVCCLFFGPRANNTSSFADSCSLNNVLFEPRIGSPS